MVPVHHRPLLVALTSSENELLPAVSTAFASSASGKACEVGDDLLNILQVRHGRHYPAALATAYACAAHGCCISLRLLADFVWSCACDRRAVPWRVRRGARVLDDLVTSFVHARMPRLLLLPLPLCSARSRSSSCCSAHYYF